LTFDLLTLKLVCESHLRWGTGLYQDIANLPHGYFNLGHLVCPPQTSVL